MCVPSSPSWTVPSLWGSLSWWWVAYVWRRTWSDVVHGCAQSWCGLWSGHSYLLTFAYGQLGLRCGNCQKNSPGWRWDVKRVRRNVHRFGARG